MKKNRDHTLALSVNGVQVWRGPMCNLQVESKEIPFDVLHHWDTQFLGKEASRLVAEWLHKKGLSYNAAADLIGTTNTTVSSWARGKHPVPGSVLLGVLWDLYRVT